MTIIEAGGNLGLGLGQKV